MVIIIFLLKNIITKSMFKKKYVLISFSEKVLEIQKNPPPPKNVTK